MAAYFGDVNQIALGVDDEIRRLMMRTEVNVVASEGSVNAEDGSDVLWGEAIAEGTLVLDAALVEKQQTVAILPRHVEVVDDEEDGLVLLAIDLTQEVEYLELVGDIEVGDWLVEEQDGSLLGQSTGYHDTLQLTATHLIGLGKAEMPGVGLFQALLHNLPVGLRFVLQTVLVRIATHEYSLEGGKLKVGMRVLADECHALSQLSGSVLQHVGVVKQYLTLLRRKQPGN